MTITVAFKTLDNNSFNLELDENLTIADVKTKIEEARGENFAVELQRLIYNGKILDDATQVSEVGFESPKFVVVMVTRKKVEAAPASTTPAAADSTTSTSAPAAAAPAVPPPAPAAPPADNFTADQESAIAAIAGMGYPRDQVIPALRAAFWNPDRAVEFLLSGIPDNIGDDEGGAIPDEDDPIANIGDEDADPVPADLNALANLPQLDEIRALIQQNPEMLGMVLQQMAHVNPQLVQAIQQNQQGFIDLLNGANVPNAAGGRRPAAAAGAGAGGAAGGGAGQGEAHVIRLSRDENDAINRIKAMGLNVTDAVIVEAYFACDKNEEAAVDFILTQLDDQ